jgi:hypothetical protein
MPERHRASQCWRRARAGASTQGTGAITLAPVSAHRWREIRGYGVALLVAVCPVPGNVAAQDRAAVGAEVGYSRADLTGENSELVESRQGAITGVYLHAPVNRVVSVRPELLFSLRGGQARVGVAGGADFAEINVELAYLEVPLLARFVLPRGRFRPVVFGGPSVALQIGCDFLFVLAADTSRSTCGEVDTTDVFDVRQVREWDLAWVAGGAIEMHLRRTTLSLQGRYTEGLRSILEGGVDLRNRGVALLFGLTF